MNKIIRNIFIIIVILIFMVGFNYSYTSLNIDNLAYVIALGIDVGETEKFKITFQFTTGLANPESGSSEKSPSIVNSVEANSIDNAISIMNSYMARELSFSHCRVLVFSEEIASYGIANEIYTLANNTELRSSANIIVSKNTTKNYIENSKPILENLITKYYEIFPNSNKYTGYVYNATLGDFFDHLISDTGEPVAILGGVNTNSQNTSTSSNSSEISDIKSTDNSVSASRGSENIGVAVFKNDKLVGELSALETLCLSIIKGTVNSFLINIPDTNNKENTIDLILSLEEKKIKVDIINNNPYITVNLKLTGRISSMKQELNYLEASILDNLSEKANNYLIDILTTYLYKTSSEFKSDINDIGKYCLSNFLTISEFKNFDWQESYSSSTFNVSVNTEIQSGFLITET